MPRIAPMLASSGPAPLSTGRWSYEVKLDGWRALLYVDPDGYEVRSRSGRVITEAVPELAWLPSALGGRSLILDGELVAGQGRPEDFYRLAPRLAATRPAARRRWSLAVPLTFGAFDLLWIDGDDLTSAPYHERRRLLVDVSFTGPSWCTVASYDGDATELLDACARLDLEGVVAKRVDSTYRSGRTSRDWVKLKTPMWIERHAPRRH